MRTAAQMVRWINARVAWTTQAGVEVPATVRDVRVLWNREQLLIEPERGRGSCWVDALKCLRVTANWPGEVNETAADETATTGQVA